MNNDYYSRPIIIAFYTIDSIYEKEAERLKSSLDRLGLDYQICPYPSLGSWLKNTSFKPTFLLEMRKKLEGQLLYLDADAYIHKDPWEELSKVNTDIAVHFRDKELLSGTILLNDTPRVLTLLELWQNQCQKHPDIWDQKILQEILSQDRTSFSCYSLPEEFCWIFDNEKRGDVYIEHLQASRENTGWKWCGLFKKAKLRRRRRRIQALEKNHILEEG